MQVQLGCLVRIGSDRFFSQQHFKLTLTGEGVGGVHAMMMNDEDGDDDTNYDDHDASYDSADNE